MYRLATGGALLDPKSVLGEAGLAAGMTYADFGCGPIGHFAFPAAEMVGKDGRVFAVDVLKGAIAGIESRLKIEAVPNLTPVWGDIERRHGVDIGDRSVDLVSLTNITGLIKKSPTVLDEVKRVLKPTGKLLLVDWEKKSALGPPASHRVTPKELQSPLLAAGFKPVRRFRAGPHHWGLVLSR